MWEREESWSVPPHPTCSHELKHDLSDTPTKGAGTLNLFQRKKIEQKQDAQGQIQRGYHGIILPLFQTTPQKQLF